uniref:Ig-like domain-containing protein n=1 Tax=Fundulus heteroclitus TaxID=8078 RepID=A0A3Q2PA75_FUNHE
MVGFWTRDINCILSFYWISTSYVEDCLYCFYFFSTALIHTLEASHQISLSLVDVGDNVTFDCNISDKDFKFVYWYKQSLGYMVESVASVVVGQPKLSEKFKGSRFAVRVEGSRYTLTISDVRKEDEATYLCQTGTTHSQEFIYATFLAVTDCNHQTSVYVEQTPEAAVARPGDTMSLQCSLFSSNNETRPQCPGKNFVHWFKAGSESSHPSIIYTARNSTDDAVKRSCVYHLSKILEDTNDFGTYYCAVAICGEILLGDGSKLETSTYSQFILNNYFCTLVLDAIALKSKEVAQYYQKLLSDREDNVNYAAVLDISATNVRHWKKRKVSTECVYSTVREDSRKQQQL